MGHEGGLSPNPPYFHKKWRPPCSFKLSASQKAFISTTREVTEGLEREACTGDGHSSQGEKEEWVAILPSLVIKVVLCSITTKVGRVGNSTPTFYIVNYWKITSFWPKRGMWRRRKEKG